MKDLRQVWKERRRRVGLVLLALLALVAFVLVGAWSWLHGAAGEAYVREQVLAALKDSIEGRVELGKLELDGEHLHLEGLALYTPEGELVAEIAVVEADVDLAALARNAVKLRRVSIERPRLYLKRDERGLNLARALEAKVAGPARSGPPPDWSIDVDTLKLAGGSVDYDDGLRRYALRELGLDGKAGVALRALRIDGKLALTGKLTEPLAAPLAIAVKASSPRGPTSTDVSLSLGDSSLRGRVETPSLEFTLDELVAAPGTMRALVPSWPLVVPLYAKGSGSSSRAVVSVRAGAASAEASGAWDASKPAIDSFKLDVREVNLAELFGAQLASRISLEGSGSLPDANVDTLAGKVQLAGTWDSTDGKRLATVTLAADAKNGRTEVRRLSLAAPGATVDVKGRASTKELALTGRLDAQDLSQLGGTVKTFAGVEVPPLSGSGSLELNVTGPASHPALKAVGKLSTLVVSSVSAQSLEVDADLPDVRKPLDTDVLLHARRLQLGARAFDEVTLDVLTHGRELDVDLATKGLGDVKVHAVGVLDKDSLGAELQVLELKTHEAAWAMEAPARVAWAGSRVEVQTLALRDGDQRVSLEGKKAGQRVEGAVHAKGVDLARLPRVLVPESLGVAGLLSLNATVTGKLPRPEGDLKLRVERGAIAGVTDVGLVVEGTWRGERAQARLEGSSSEGSIKGELDVPVFALLDEKPEPLSAHLEVRGVDSTKLASLFKRPVPVQLVAAIDLDVGGTASAPTTRLKVEAPTLTVDQAPRPPLVIEHPKVVLFTREPRVARERSAREKEAPLAGELSAEVSGAVLGGEVSLTLDTDWTIPRLRSEKPGADALKKSAVQLRAEVKDVDVPALERAGLIEDDELTGRLGLIAALYGTAEAPRGDFTVTIARADLAPFKALDAKLHVRALEERTVVDGSAKLGEKDALTLEGAIEAPVEHLQRLDALGERKVTLRLAVLPLDLTQVLVAKPGELQTRGSAQVSVELDGTLDSPRLRVAGAVQNLAFDKAVLGSARLLVTGEPAKQNVTLALGGLGGEDLKVKGTTGLDFSLPALRKASQGFAWRQAPVALDIEARDLDLAFLSGAHPLLRLVGGRLRMTGGVKGTLGSPSFTGDASWQRGRLSLFGYGDYREIELEVHATNDLVDVQKLRVKAGAGLASLKARAERQPTNAFRLTAEGSADKFPLINDDQLLATTSLKLTLQGELSDQLIDVRSLDLPRVDVELPELKRKDLQDLDRPKDIILLRDGKRPSKKQRREVKQAAQVDPNEPPPRAFRALVNAPRNVWVRSSDLNVELGLSEAFRVERTDAVQIFGEASILRGTLSVIGREFVVQKNSQVRFAGVAKEPYVNVTALHTNDKEKVKVTVTVVGKGTDVTLKATSEPAMPESEIYTLLATGRRELRRGSGASITPGQAASVVGQLAASQMKKVLAKNVPIDVFNFEASDDFNRLRFDVGKYLSDSLYLGVTAQTGANKARGENNWAGRLEWQLARQWSLEVYGGDAPAAGADLVWSTDF